jgi:galactose mutarotase-like enzyme
MEGFPVLTTLSNRSLEAQILTLGAELVRLRDEGGRDLLWSGDPAYWTNRSPLLFPIVGRLKDDRILIDGSEFSLRQHGFARTSQFEIVEIGQESCCLRLRSSRSMLGQYPFEFELDVSYRIEELKLVMAATVRNVGRRTMPASFGFHPAFRWPLPYGGSRESHRIRFERTETEALCTLVDSLLGPRIRPTPVEDHLLNLRDELFAEGALVFDRLASRTVEYGVPGRRSITVTFPDMPHLGIWTKPGAGFVCIEPWQGYASPAGFNGELSDKPGSVLIGPGDGRSFSMDICISR